MSLVQGVHNEHGRIRKAVAAAFVIAVVPGALVVTVGYGLYHGARYVSRRVKSFTRDHHRSVHLVNIFRKVDGQTGYRW